MRNEDKVDTPTCLYLINWQTLIYLQHSLFKIYASYKVTLLSTVAKIGSNRLPIKDPPLWAKTRLLTLHRRSPSISLRRTCLCRYRSRCWQALRGTLPFKILRAHSHNDCTRSLSALFKNTCALFGLIRASARKSWMLSFTHLDMTVYWHNIRITTYIY